MLQSQTSWIDVSTIWDWGIIGSTWTMCQKRREHFCSWTRTRIASLPPFTGLSVGSASLCWSPASLTRPLAEGDWVSRTPGSGAGREREGVEAQLMEKLRSALLVVVVRTQ